MDFKGKVIHFNLEKTKFPYGIPSWHKWFLLSFSVLVYSQNVVGNNNLILSLPTLFQLSFYVQELKSLQFTSITALF